MLAFVTKNHALTAVRKPLPRLRPGWALVRVRLAGICNTDVEILRGYHTFSRNSRPRIRRRSSGRARRAKPRKEKLAGPPRRRRNQYRLRGSRLPPALRILPPRIENPLRPPQSSRHRRSRWRIRRIPRPTARKSPRDPRHNHRRASRLRRAARRSLRNSRSSSRKRIP